MRQRNSVEELTQSEDLNELGYQAGKPSISRSKKRLRSKRSSYEDFEIPFFHANEDLIKIGDRTRKDPLEGQPVRDYCGVFAIPENIDSVSGVLAELNVRESWVRFRDPKTESATHASKLWNYVSNSDLKEHSKKKELFSDLLKKLAYLNLQDASKKNSATLDLAAIVCKPNDESVLSLVKSQSEPLSVSLEGDDDLVEFLECKPGEEKRKIASLVASAKMANSQSHRMFTPHSNVANALKTFSNFLSAAPNDWPAKSIRQAESSFGRNEIRDLMVLGVIVNDYGVAAVRNPFPDVDPETSLKALVAKENSIRFVRDYLEGNPSASAVQIGSAVAKNFDRKWRHSSCQSNGHRLRSWAGFAYGNLLLNEAGIPYYRGHEELGKGSSRRGPIPYMTGDMLERVSKMKAKGLSITAMVRELNISPQTIRTYKKNHATEWDEL